MGVYVFAGPICSSGLDPRSIANYAMITTRWSLSRQKKRVDP